VREKIKEKEKRYACVNSATPHVEVHYSHICASQMHFAFDLHNRMEGLDFLEN
jgi:hypothetical protein